jgi:LmbE family N-acetylglucosaminyl deacetylase
MESADVEAKSRTLLVLSPHPDDLELSAGLLCHRALESGWRVSEIILTDGRMGGMNPARFGTTAHVTQRAREALASARVLGGVGVRFLGAPDGRLHTHFPEAVEMVGDELRSLEPDVVCFPSLRDRHADHRTAHLLTIAALKEHERAARPVLLQYCFWGHDERTNVRLDHPAGKDAKVRALREHRSQPIEAYLPLLRKTAGADDFLACEFFYAPRPNQASRFLLRAGFDVRQLVA